MSLRANMRITVNHELHLLLGLLIHGSHIEFAFYVMPHGPGRLLRVLLRLIQFESALEDA